MNSYPQRVDDILRFISDFTIYVDGVGDVCRFSAAVSFLSFLALIFVSTFAILNIFISLSFNSLSLFDFKRHGNTNYGSPFNGLKSLRSSQGKMEKSFLRYMQFQVLFIFFYYACSVTYHKCILCAVKGWFCLGELEYFNSCSEVLVFCWMRFLQDYV